MISSPVPMEKPADSPVLPDADVSFQISESLAPLRTNKAAVITSLSFDGLLKEPLLLKEDLKEGCGGQLWPAGIVLAKYLLRRHPIDLADKTMLVSLGAASSHLLDVTH